jgi:hypothetical protein
MSAEEKVKEAIADHIESLKDSDVQRLEFINATIAFMMFHKRYAELKPHEKIACDMALDGSHLNDNERKKLAQIKNKMHKDEYLSGIARANYFRRCAWLSYLNGDPNCDKPNIAEPQ